MKKLIVICLISFIACTIDAQVKKESVPLDTSQIEKIKKMPMDTVYNKMPTKPVLPEEQKKGDSTASPIHHTRKK